MIFGNKWCIAKAEIRPLHAPLIQPFRTALGDHNTLDNLLFTLKISDGTTGYGEAAVASHITGETLGTTERNLKDAAQWLKGKDIREYLSISNALHEFWDKNPAMIAAVETALLDCLTQQLNIPLWKFFGDTCPKLTTDITIVIGSLEETEQTAQKYYRQGFRSFKIKIGRNIDLDIKRIIAIKKSAPKCALYLDANQGFSAQQILGLIQELKKLKIRPALIEQPVPREDREGLKKVSHSTDIPVCADESVRSISEAVWIIKEKAASVINIKLMKFGFVHAREIANLARANGVELMIGGMMESSLAMTASAHMAAGLNCFSYVDLDTPFFIKNDSKRNPYLSNKGVYDLNKVKKGIGIKPL